MKRRKIIVLGIDGATFDIIGPLIKKGKLPNLKKLMGGGIYGALESTSPPVTCPAWLSFITGKNPGKFGIYNMAQDNFSYNRIKSKKIWDYFSARQLRSVIVNVPITYPPKINRGIMVSGLGTLDNNFTFPEYISKELMQSVEGYSPQVPKEVHSYLHNQKKWWRLFLNWSKKNYQGAKFLFDKYDPDLFIYVITSVDLVGHACWNNKKKIQFVYRMIDNFIGSFIAVDYNIIIISDHGFKGVNKYIRINMLFEEMGLLRRKKSTNKVPQQTAFYFLLNRTFKALGITKERVLKFVPSYITRLLSKILSPVAAAKLLPMSWEVDFKNSKAYMVSGLYNHVIVKAEHKREHKHIVEQIKKGLKQLRDPQNGKPVFMRVLSREEAYTGMYVRKAPEIVVQEYEDYVVSADFGEKIIEQSNIEIPCHSPHGIFIAKGPDIAKSKKIRRLRIIDLAPLILGLANLKIPKGMDGKIRNEVFNKDLQLSRRKNKL